MSEEHAPPDFLPPTPPSVRLGDVTWRTFGWSLFFIVTFAVVLGLVIFYYIVVRLLGMNP